MRTLTPKQISNSIKKEQKLIEEQKSQKHVKSLTISIEWRKSRTWGHNPHAEVAVEFHDGTFIRKDGYKCSGCGYDKESTVIAEIFNDFLRYKLYEKHELESRINGETTNHPYGVYYYDGKVIPPKPGDYYYSKPSFNHGVGTSCYYSIGKFIGGTFENVASGKSFSVFKYTDGKQKGNL
jgi:hypothetical protein